MGQIICHHKGRYNLYSTISDGFAFVSSLSKRQLEFVIKEEQGSRGLSQLPERLKRAHKKGTSSMEHDDLEDTLACNVAGDNGGSLTVQQCIDQYLSDPPKEENKQSTK